MSYSAVAKDLFPPEIKKSGRTLLWEWNGVDTSQFGPHLFVKAAGASTGTRAGNATVVAGNTVSSQLGGNVLALQLTGSGGSGFRYSVWPILADLPQSYEVEIFSASATYGNDGNNGTGCLVMADPDFDHGYVWHQGGRRARVDNGAVQNANTVSTLGTTVSGQYRIRVEGRPAPLDDYAHFQLLIEFDQGTSEQTSFLRNAFDANDGDWNLSSAGLPPASWKNSEANRFALMMMNFTNNQTWYISSIRIFSL